MTSATYRSRGRPGEARERGLSAELAAYERGDSPLLDALIFADMTTGRAGQPFDFDERMDEILRRDAAGSDVHTAITRAHPYLGDAVTRTWRRFAVSASLRPSRRAGTLRPSHGHAPDQQKGPTEAGPTRGAPGRSRQTWLVTGTMLICGFARRCG